MAVTWARAEIQVDVDGSGVPRQVRMIAESAASDGGKAFNKKFDQELSKWDGKGFRQALSKFFKSGDAKGLNAWFDGVKSRMRDTNKELDKHQSLWSKLSHNTRQWTLIIGAVIASMESLAVLGSAAGAGILALGSALSSAAIGGIALITVFSNFAGEIGDLPEEVRDAARAFQDLGKRFSTLRDTLQIDALADTTDAWKSLGETIEDITPAFKPLTTVINNLVKDLAKNLQKGTKGFNALFAVIEKGAPTFDALVRIAGNLGIALAQGFVKAQPLVDQMIGWLDRLTDKFLAFTESDDFDVWVSNAMRVFSALGGVLDAVGTALDELVDQEAVDRLISFLDNIAKFIEGPAVDLLNIFGELDIFGLLAEALVTFGDALAPLAKPMEEFAGAINDVIQSGIATLGPIIEDVASALAPFVTEIGNFIKQNPKQVADFILGIAAAFVILKGAQGLAGVAGALAGIVGQFDNITKKAPTWSAGIGGLMAGILSALPGAADGEVAGTDVVTGMASALAAGAVVGGPLGAAIGAISFLVTSMITDMTNETEGVWNEGWDQIFDPTNHEAAGLGPFKAWLGETYEFIKADTENFFGGMDERWNQGWSDMDTAARTWWDGISTEWQNFLDDIVRNFALMGTNIDREWNNFLSDIERNFKKIGENVSREFGNFQRDVERNWKAIERAIQTSVDNIAGFIGDLWRPIQNAINWFNNLFSAANNAASAGSRARAGGGEFASGGILYGPHRILAGEAGPEAIVPLHRALSRVDPSVRALSAIAQGLTPMASGGTVGSGRSVNVEAGAVVIQGVRDPFLAAHNVVNGLAERIAS